MLEPRDRRLLLESLRPPAGYRLDRAIGTTFSLDLLTLLSVPLAFTSFDLEDDGGGQTADPLALLEAVRRYADRISVFCQAGQIAVPRSRQTLYGYLEGSVFEVLAPNPNGLFHPKVWVLRFTGPGGSVLYRLLVLSRNLTFDRSWDTMLVMDGELTDRTYAFASNHPLGDFVAALPSLAVRPIPEPVRADIERVQGELRRVRFDPPDGFEGVSFWPLGLRGKSAWPMRGRVDRMLVISPFVSEGCLGRLTASGQGHVLVSRPESLAGLDQRSLDPFDSVRVLSDAANPESLDDIDAASELSDDDSGPAVEGGIALSGLHAKVFIADAGWNARVWTGSANATDAAFGGNVEFLVELVGKKSRCGIDAVLGAGDDRLSFADLLQEYDPWGEEVTADPEQQRLEMAVEESRRRLARMGLVAKVTPSDDTREHRLSVHLSSDGIADLPLETQARCWPVTLREEVAVIFSGGAGEDSSGAPALATFGPLSFEAITSFFAFHLRATAERKTASARFVLNLPLVGAPADRSERILLSVLRSREQVLRYLLLLLTEEGLDSRDALVIHRLVHSRGAGDGRSLGLPLLEALIRALDRRPAQLDQIARLVDDLKRTPEGQELLPEGFDAVWQPIWSVRKGLGT